MEGYLFKSKNNYYFIETNYKRKTKTIAKRFLDYLVQKYEGCGFIPLNVIQNTFNRIYNDMKLVDIKLSDNEQWYYIHEEYGGETVPSKEVTILKGGE